MLAAAEAWCQLEGESQNYHEECQHKDGGVGDTDGLPTVEPNFSAPAKSVHCAPETVREVEPDSHEPDDVE